MVLTAFELSVLLFSPPLYFSSLSIKGRQRSSLGSLACYLPGIRVVTPVWSQFTTRTSLVEHFILWQNKGWTEIDVDQCRTKQRRWCHPTLTYWFSYSIVAIFIGLFLSLSTNSTDSLVKVEQNGTSCSPSWGRKPRHIVEIWTKITHNSVRMRSLTEILPHHLIYLSAREGKRTNWSHTESSTLYILHGSGQVHHCHRRPADLEMFPKHHEYFTSTGGPWLWWVSINSPQMHQFYGKRC